MSNPHFPLPAEAAAQLSLPFDAPPEAVSARETAPATRRGAQYGPKSAQEAAAEAPGNAPRPTLAAARTAAEILAAVAGWCWREAHHAECPAARVPALGELGAVALPVDAVQAAVAASSAVVGGKPMPMRMMVGPDPDGPQPPMPGGLALYSVWLPVRTARPDLAPKPDPEHPGGAIEAVHAAWRERPEPRPLHPLAPLVDAWQRITPVDVVPDRRRRAILPAPLGAARRRAP